MEQRQREKQIKNTGYSRQTAAGYSPKATAGITWQLFIYA